MQNLTRRSTLISLLSFIFLFGIFALFVGGDVMAQQQQGQTGQQNVNQGAQQRLTATVRVDQSEIGFTIPTLSDVLTFVIRGFFIIAGLAALFFLLLGAFAWVTSGGEEDNISKARDKITAAIVGVILIVVVLAVIVTLEQIVFQSRICFGLSCAASIPDLVEPCGPNTCDVDCDNYYNNSTDECRAKNPQENSVDGVQGDDNDPSVPGGF